MTEKTEIRDELVPCPFCGKPGNVTHNSVYWRVECSACPARVHAEFNGPTGCEDAIAAWNRRSPTPAALFKAIEHGDAAHREWLRDALDCFFAGRPVSPAMPPTPAGREELVRALERAHVVLENMARENVPKIAFKFQRWPIHHEPLRADARNLLPVIEAALSSHSPPGK